MTAVPTRERQREAPSNEAPEAVTSFLAGIGGNGTMTVVRDRNEHAVEITGTWRPAEEGSDLTALQRAFDEQDPVRFEGRLVDPAAPERTEVVARVTIRTFGDYAFDATLDEGERGPNLRVFNLSPVDEGEVLDRG